MNRTLIPERCENKAGGHFQQTALLMFEPAGDPHVLTGFRGNVGQRSDLNRLLRLITHLRRMTRLCFSKPIGNHGRFLDLRDRLYSGLLLSGKLRQNFLQVRAARR